jgi:hypothetical protein
VNEENSMIQALSHTTVYVVDQESARAFYVDKLGFEIRADVRMGNLRWLTVGPKAQPGLEMVLMHIAESPMMDARAAGMLRELVEMGAIGCGVLETDDCKATYEELSRRASDSQVLPPNVRTGSKRC